MTRTYQDVTFECRDGVGHIVLNRPQSLNSLTRAMHEDLQAALSELESQASLRGVVLTGAGRGFCAGQDLSERAPLPPGEFRDLGKGIDDYYKPLILRLRALPAPVICVINGVAAGAGLSLALSGDIVIATRSAKFAPAFAKIGLMPDAGGSYFLPRMAGTQRAMAAFFFGEVIDAETAEKWGMVARVIADDDLGKTIADLHERLAHGPTQAFRFTKKAIYASGQNSLEAQIDLERDGQRTLGYTDDYREGMTAFFEKRRPCFKGC